MRNSLIAALGLGVGILLARFLAGPPVAPSVRADPGVLEPRATPAVGAHTLGRIEQAGLAVSFEVTNLHPERAGDGLLVAGDPVEFRFRIEDTAAGRPVSGAYPAGWVDRREGGDALDRKTTLRKIESFIEGSIFQRAALDLNVYYVLTLNNTPTISVVDPLFGFGGSKLLAQIELPGVGCDWGLSPSGERLYVSVPEAGVVSVVDTATFEVTGNLPLPGRPGQLAVQGDGGYVWVLCEGTGSKGSRDSGPDSVAVLRTEDLELVGEIELGPGPHDLMVAGDLRHAYISHLARGTVTVVDVDELRSIAEVEVVAAPNSIAWSEAAECAYVGCAESGALVALRGTEVLPVAGFVAEGPLGAIRFEPGGRYGFALQPEADRLLVFDSATGRLVHRATTNATPDSIAFSADMAYVGHRGSPDVLLFPLTQLGKPSLELTAAEFAGGQNPLEGAGESPATKMVPAPGTNAMLLANPLDQAVYFYKEGMASPLGSFRGYGGEPHAVLAVDRSLRERNGRGNYETVRRLPGAGQYDVLCFLDAPRITHAFELTVLPDPANEAAEAEGARIRVARAPETMPAGEATQVEFEILRSPTGQACRDISDLAALVYLNPGIWSWREQLHDRGDGVYSFAFTPPEPGLYDLFLNCPSEGLAFEDPWRLRLEAVAPGSSSDPDPGP